MEQHGEEDTFFRECDLFSVSRLLLLIILVRLLETGALFTTVISIEV